MQCRWLFAHGRTLWSAGCRVVAYSVRWDICFWTFLQVLNARIYDVAIDTPLQKAVNMSNDLSNNIFFKVGARRTCGFFNVSFLGVVLPRTGSDRVPCTQVIASQTRNIR